jgi:tellurite methyltransferase
MNGGYDSGYSACSCFWGRTPGSLVMRLVNLVGDVSNKSVLDVGCGEGKNAFYLSSIGATVRALDISELAITNARRAWKITKNIKWEVADIRKLHLSDNIYDIVIAYGLLHCLSDPGQIEAVVKKLQKATKNHGYNILCAFNDRSQDLAAHPEFTPCLVNHRFYLALYSGWEVIEASDTDLTEIHPHNNIEHTHSMTRILAQKLL